MRIKLPKIGLGPSNEEVWGKARRQAVKMAQANYAAKMQGVRAPVAEAFTAVDPQFSFGIAPAATDTVHTCYGTAVRAANRLWVVDYGVSLDVLLQSCHGREVEIEVCLDDSMKPAVRLRGPAQVEHGILSINGFELFAHLCPYWEEEGASRKFHMDIHFHDEAEPWCAKAIQQMAMSNRMKDVANGVVDSLSIKVKRGEPVEAHLKYLFP